MADPEPDLGADLQAGEPHEHVEGVGDPAVGRVLQRDEPELDVAAVDLLEDRRDRADRDVLDRLAELGHRGEVAVAVLRPEAGHPELPLERPRAAHQLAEDQLERLQGQGPLAQLGRPGDDLVLARGRPDVEPLRLLELADLDGDLRAVIQEADQIPVDPVDLRAEVRERRRVLRGRRGGPGRLRLGGGRLGGRGRLARHGATLRQGPARSFRPVRGGVGFTV